MRLFIAAELPDAVIETLAETSSALRASVRGRYVAPDSFHITLAFLGEVEAYRVDDVAAALKAACSGVGPFEIALGDFGKFGKRSSATLWQGFRDPGAFSELAQSVRCELRNAGFSFDAKAFLPHVTLMRAADLTSGSLPMPPRARGLVDAVSLFRSDLSGARPRYDSLYTEHLG